MAPITPHHKCLAVLSCDLSLIAIHITDCGQFSDIHISQSIVGTYLRCGGIFKYESIANLPMSQSVNEFRKSVNIWGSYGQEFSVLFLTHGVYGPAKVFVVATVDVLVGAGA